jgi:uroporphyrinogen III methyltransferase / synthase
VALNTVKSRTLAGRRIVVTRALEQSKELCERLEELGAEVLLLPMVRFLEPDNTLDLDHAIRSLDKFDWLIFTSANAVTFSLHRCRALGLWPSSERAKIAVVGSATRLALEKEGLRASLVPAEFSGAGLAAELSSEIAGKTVLLPRSDRASGELPSLLREAGANVTEVVAYRTAGPKALDTTVIGAILSGQVDAITFFSPSAFREFQNLTGDETLRRLAPQVTFVAVGPVTAEAIRGSGLPVVIEADQATTASLVATLERHFSAPEIELARELRPQNRRQP